MEISENELVRRIKAGEKKTRTVIRGIGDDGAVARMTAGSYVFVQDAMVEHIHFKFDFVDPYDVGKKAVYVNVSDILSMGALPVYYMVTIAIPTHISSDHVKSLYRGMNQAGKEFGVTLIGGDTTRSGKDFFIDVSMVGRVVTREYLGRNKAKEGDLIGVTGLLGESAFGLLLLQNGRSGRGLDPFIRRYRSPKPPYPVWKELVENDITHAMMDISDGLLIDLERMMVESRKGARVNLDQVPMPGILRKEKREELALSGGEDYQFLFTFPPAKLKKVYEITQKGFPVSVVGEVCKGKGVRLFDQGRERPITSKGYDHFGNTA
jgi:thiamine-monophosphate kinase